MNVTIAPGTRRGVVRVPSSKSLAHRFLICAALGRTKTTLNCVGDSEDVTATADCLRALGAVIDTQQPGKMNVTPIRSVPKAAVRLNCGESASTLRFLLPVAGALGITAEFRREGSLTKRPIAPLDTLLRSKGMQIQSKDERLNCEGNLLAGDYEIRGDISSQFLSGLLLALPLLDGDSTLRVAGELESASYVGLTEMVLRLAGVRIERMGNRCRIPGGQCFALPSTVCVEGDWSSAAFFLCAGALSREGITATGLNRRSVQGDRAVLELLRRFGAAVASDGDSVTVRRYALHGCEIDAAQVPDLVPALSAVAACAEGETRVINAARLRLKESDRLKSTAAMLTALGADIRELPDGLVIRGTDVLRGGAVDTANDHRIAMAAAVAACGCSGPVTVCGAECVAKSYPAFWEEAIWRSM